MNATRSSGQRIILIAALFAIALFAVFAALPSSASADGLPSYVAQAKGGTIPATVTFLGVERVPEGGRWTYEIYTGANPSLNHLEMSLPGVPDEALVASSHPSLKLKNGKLKLQVQVPHNAGPASDLAAEDTQAGLSNDDGELVLIWFTLSSALVPGDVKVTLTHGNASFETMTSGPLAGVSPTAVTLGDTELLPARGGILIQWTTGSEIDNLGFNIYRNRVDEAVSATMVNGELIPSQAIGQMSGANYHFLDTTARQGIAFHYWLENVGAGAMPAQGSDEWLLGLTPLGQATWAAPKALRVTPKGGAVQSLKTRNLTATLKDADGDMAAVYLLINDAAGLEGGVMARYDLTTGLLALYDERSQAWSAQIAPGQAANAACRYASLRGLGSRVKMLQDGQVVRVTFRLKFWKRFVGQHNIYLMAEDAAGNTSGWRLMGNLAVR